MPAIRITASPRTREILARLNAVGSRGIVFGTAVEQVKTIAEMALEAAKAATPGKGRIRSQWTLKSLRGEGFVSYLLRNKAQDTFPKDKKGRGIVDYLEFGTKSHVIYPKNAAALRFMIGNRVVFAKYVFHPGTKPYRMVGEASKVVEKMTQEYERVLRRKLSRIFDEL